MRNLAPSKRGAAVLLGLVVFGLIIIGGIYLVPKATAPPAPANLQWGMPARTLRFVAYDLARQHPRADPLFASIQRLNPDFVLLQGVDEDDGTEIAQALGMEQYFHPQLYQRSQNIGGRRGTWGKLILSRFPLYAGSPMGNIRGGFGAMATAVVDGRAFLVADLHFSSDNAADEISQFKQIWSSGGEHPMVAAVLSSDAAVPATISFLTPGQSNGPEAFFFTGGWSIVSQGKASDSGAGLSPIWINLGRAMETREAK